MLRGCAADTLGALAVHLWSISLVGVSLPKVENELNKYSMTPIGVYYTVVL